MGIMILMATETLTLTLTLYLVLSVQDAACVAEAVTVLRTRMMTESERGPASGHRYKFVLS